MLSNIGLGLETFFSTLNNSKYFSGIMMLLLNIGGKQVSNEISHFQENIGLEPIFDKGAVLKKASDWILEDEQKIELVAELESKLDLRSYE